MDKAVADTHCLLGSQLRDPDSGRLGRIVGIDQSRETPALLVNWGQSAVERVALSVTELSDLVTASLAHERNVRGNGASSERQPSRSAAPASKRSRRDQPAGRAADDEAAPNASSSAASGAVGYRPLATGSDGRR